MKFRLCLLAGDMVDERNVLAKPIKQDILEKLSIEQDVKEDYCPFGDGNSAIKIVEAMANYKEDSL